MEVLLFFANTLSIHQQVLPMLFSVRLQISSNFPNDQFASEIRFFYILEPLTNYHLQNINHFLLLLLIFSTKIFFHAIIAIFCPYLLYFFHDSPLHIPTSSFVHSNDEYLHQCSLSLFLQHLEVTNLKFFDDKQDKYL